MSIFNFNKPKILLSSTVLLTLFAMPVCLFALTPTPQPTLQPTFETVPEYYLNTRKPTEITATSVSLSGYVEEHGLSAVLYLNYWEKNNPDVVFCANENSSKNITITVYNLKPNTEYCCIASTKRHINYREGHGGYEQTFKTLPLQTYGDANNDGVVDSADYTYLRKYLLQFDNTTPDPSWLISCDLNFDGTIDSADYLILNKFLIGKISELPYKL